MNASFIININNNLKLDEMATQDLLTYKCKSLGYAEVGAGAEASYTPLMGVLEGLSISQETASESAINGEFYDTPLDSVGTWFLQD